jgi:hypothetical protein
VCTHRAWAVVVIEGRWIQSLASDYMQATLLCVFRGREVSRFSEAKLVVCFEFWVHALVEVHEDRVLCVDGTVKRALHVPVCPKAFFDVPLSAIPKRDGSNVE